MIWSDGTILPDDGLSISVLDRTFEHGLGLFETLRTWGGRPTLLEDHKARMLRSASELGLSIDPAGLPNAKAVRQLLEAEGAEGDRMLRITASGGTASGPSVVWMRSSPLPPPNREGGAVVCVNAWSIKPEPSPREIEDGNDQNRGLAPDELPPPLWGRAGVGGAWPDQERSMASSTSSDLPDEPFNESSVLPPSPHPNPPPQGGREPEARSARGEWRLDQNQMAPEDFTTRHKTLNYWFKRVAHEQARDRGYDETLISLEPWGLIEASRSSLFLVADHALITCSARAPIVPGIMRQLVLEIAKGLPIEGREVERIDSHRLASADEIFLTNAVRGIIPVARVDTSGRTIERKAPGPWTGRLQELMVRRLWPVQGEFPR
jgi:branched-subunit amino acid aminotransferase/4-amino-4-deoxychorismate lyase